VGVDFLDEQSHRGLEAIMQQTDLNRFLMRRDQALIGAGVDAWLRAHHYGATFKLFTPSGRPVVLKRFGVLPPSTRLLTNDMVLVPIQTARTILGLKRNEATDYVFNAPNELEWEVIPIKVAALDYDLRVVSKKEARKAYEEMFDYRNGLFLMLFLMALVAYLMVIYQRQAQLYSVEKRTVGILRALGWSRQEMIALKLIESLMIILIAFGLGIALAYGYVFVLGAPGLVRIFVAPANLPMAPVLTPQIDLFVVMTLFLLYALPTIAAVILPVWRTASASPGEAIR
jgi:ABC-type lipoprotein release transport system permease subunit